MHKPRIRFSKAGTARYISHLDLMRTMHRAFLRAGILIAHSQGFNPHPYTAIPLPLPLGFSSDCELMEFGLAEGSDACALPLRLNEALPPGITVQRCYEGGLPFRRLSFVRYEIDMEYDDAALAERAKSALEELLSRESHLIQKRSKKAKSGFVELDLIPQINRIERLLATEGRLHLQILLRAQNPGLNPELLIRALETEQPQLSPAYSEFHRCEIFDEELNPFR